jgi:hypothetical protein
MKKGSLFNTKLHRFEAFFRCGFVIPLYLCFYSNPVKFPQAYYLKMIKYLNWMENSQMGYGIKRRPREDQIIPLDLEK